MDEEQEPIEVSATWVLLGLNVAVFVLMLLQGVDAANPSPIDLLRFGANRGVSVVGDNQWWRTFMSMFIHVGFVHLAVNMFSLTQIGFSVERLFGQFFYVTLYVFSGLLGSLASNIYNPLTVSAGASGALFGLLGALLAFTFLAGSRFDQRAIRGMRRGLLISIGLNVAYGLMNPRLDNACHFGGFVGGFGAGAMLTVLLPLHTVKAKALTVLGFVAIVVLVATATIWRVNREPLVEFQHRMETAEKARLNGDHAAVVAELTEALRNAPDSVKSLPDAMLTIRSLRADALSALGRYPEAALDYQSLLKDGDDPVLRNNLAWAQLYDNKLELALDNVNRAIGLSPSATAYGTRCFIQASRDAFSEALADCKLATTGSDANGYDLGMLAFLEARYADAIKYWTAAARTPRAQQELQEWIARAQAKQSETQVK
jgi:membrane associated rhomboid family serine protease/Flp pilus assembly protein TadD